MLETSSLSLPCHSSQGSGLASEAGCAAAMGSGVVGTPVVFYVLCFNKTPQNCRAGLARWEFYSRLGVSQEAGADPDTARCCVLLGFLPLHSSSLPLWGHFLLLVGFSHLLRLRPWLQLPKDQGQELRGSAGTSDFGSPRFSLSSLSPGTCLVLLTAS